MTKLLTLRRILALCAVLLIGGTLLLRAQTRPGPTQATTPADQAAQALNLGKFEEVERLLSNARDPRSIAILARAHTQRGRYADAEKLLAPAAAAQPGSDAALELGLLQLHLGRRADGNRTLERLVDTVNPATAADYLRLGLAARALGAYQDANSFFRDGNRLAPDDAAINTAWGETFLEKYNPGDAMKSFQAALRVDEQNVAARIGLARVAYAQNPPAAKSAVEAALKTNPNYVPAHLLQAEIAMDERRRDDARASIEAALKINANSLEARSLRGAMAFLDDNTQELESEAQAVLKINPVYGEVYRVAGDHAARNYRFDEAVALVRRALQIDPDSDRAHADLGLHLLRTGDEPAARVALERAFKGDPYDQVTYNLLALLDTLDKFETVTDGKIVMKFAPEEAAVMKEQALPLAKEALSTLEKLYGFETKGPILIEMFPKHDDFAVRTLGLPGMVGALGVAFGRVVTLDSPRARPPGQFNWQETLWHELAHIVTLQMSQNRLPRWVSEGTSVREERRARPEWGREMELPFAQAMNEDKVLKLASLNEGFGDARTISLAYYQASLVVEHLVDSYGEEKFHTFIRAFGKGLETDEAFKAAFGASTEEIEKAFTGRIDKQFAGLRAALKTPELEGKPSLEELKKLAESNPQSFAVQMQLGMMLAEAKQYPEAIAALERAAKLVPRATGDNNPHKLMAAIATEQGNTAQAIAALEAAVRVESSDVESARKLAALLAATGDAARAEDAWTRVVNVDPFDSQAQTALGRLALERKDSGLALRAFRSALATNPPDRAAAHLDLAEAHLAAGQVAEARRQTIAALEIAPSFERAQDLLLKIVDAGGGA